MKKLFQFTLFISAKLLSIAVLGLLIPIFISSFCVLLTNATYSECVMSFPFWLFTVIGWVGGFVILKDIKIKFD